MYAKIVQEDLVLGRAWGPVCFCVVFRLLGYAILFFPGKVCFEVWVFLQASPKVASFLRENVSVIYTVI